MLKGISMSLHFFNLTKFAKVCLPTDKAVFINEKIKQTFIITSLFLIPIKYFCRQFSLYLTYNENNNNNNNNNNNLISKKIPQKGNEVHEQFKYHHLSTVN